MYGFTSYSGMAIESHFLSSLYPRIQSYCSGSPLSFATISRTDQPSKYSTVQASNIMILELMTFVGCSWYGFGLKCGTNSGEIPTSLPLIPKSHSRLYESVAVGRCPTGVISVPKQVIVFIRTHQLVFIGFLLIPV